MLIAAVVMLNVIAVLLGERYPLGADFSTGAVFKLDYATREYIRGITSDVDIYVLADPDEFLAEGYLIQAQRIIEQFPRYSGRIRLKYTDYASDPSFARQFPELPLEHGNIIVTGDGRVKKITLSELFNFTYADAGGNIAISSSRAEEAIASAIAYVTSEYRAGVALLTGGGAAEMPALSRVLTDNNFDVREINLATEDLGSGFEIAVFLSPKSDLSANEMEKIDAFLYNGGAYGKSLFYTADPSQPPLPNIDAFLAEWGVSVGDGVVFETDASRTYMNQPYYTIPGYADEGYAGKLSDAKSHILLPMSRPMNVLFHSRDDNFTTVLLEFGASSGVRPPDAPDGFLASQAEERGPLPAMALAEKRIYENGVVKASSNVIVSASTQMLETSTFYSTVLTNGEYLMNVFNTVTKREDALNIRPKSMGGYAFGISSGQSVGIGVTMFAILPALIIGTGIIVWLKRRYN